MVNMVIVVTSFINSLPRCPATLDLVIVRREGSATSHRDFKICRSVILRALLWLIEHNMYYSDVTIDHHILLQLLDDSDISNHFVTAPSNQEQDPVQHDGNPSTDHFQSTFVPMATRSQTEQQAIHSILDPPTLQRISWPPTRDTPTVLMNLPPLCDYATVV